MSGPPECFRLNSSDHRCERMAFCENLNVNKRILRWGGESVFWLNNYMDGKLFAPQQFVCYKPLNAKIGSFESVVPQITCHGMVQKCNFGLGTVDFLSAHRGMFPFAAYVENNDGAAIWCSHECFLCVWFRETTKCRQPLQLCENYTKMNFVRGRNIAFLQKTVPCPLK